MSFEYFCTNCGRRLTQNDVLFDMQYIITKDKHKKFNILKFRMPLAQLTELYNSGIPTEDNFRKITMSLRQFMEIVCEPCNLNDPQKVIADLSMEDIMDYTGTSVVSLNENEPEEKEDIFGNGSNGLPFAPIFGAPETPDEDKPAEEPAEGKHLSEAILALQKQDTTNKDLALTKSLLSEDLQYLRIQFGETGNYEFQLELLNDISNIGENVVTGYKLYPALYIDSTAAPRVCPGSVNRACGYPVFPYAGTAQHHRVVFFGPQESGKTSLLVSLTHYATQGMKIALGENLWKNLGRITAVKEIDLLNHEASNEKEKTESDETKRDRSLYRDLELFAQGIAPAKTDADRASSAYSATLRLQDSAGQFHLLTLTDLPGELIQNTSGKIELGDLDTKFPTALSCDAYVVCFDTSKRDAVQNQVKITVDSVNTLQKLHAEKRKSNAHIPMIVVYTKCSELEEEDALPDPGFMANGFGVTAAHTFCAEWKKISEDEAYRYVFEQFNQSEHTKDAFKAALRCSAYGYPAPTTDDISKGKEKHLPKPLYVDHLMRWILAVCGCIPVEGTFKKTFGAGSGWSEPANFFDRLQLRKEKPKSFQEALARVILFANPGDIDTKYVQAHGSKLSETRAVVEAALKQEQK